MKEMIGGFKSMKGCCGTGNETGTDDKYEVVRIAKTKNSCSLCDDYADQQKIKPVAVACCEGACLRGEVARQAANILCHSLARDKTVRICLGSVFTKDGGQRGLVRNASRLITLEGCIVNCGSRMIDGVTKGIEQEVINVDRLYNFDRTLFGIDEMSPEEVRVHAMVVAEKIAANL